MKIGIIGKGYVGDAVRNGFESKGFTVKAHDKFKEGDSFEDVATCDFIFICVPTPTVDGEIDLHHIKEVTEKLGVALARQQDYHLIVIKSTVTPTTTENVVIPIIKRYKKVGKEVGICMNPEFLTQISHTWTDAAEYGRDFFNEDRIVIGEYDKKSGDTLEELYKPLNKPIFRTDLKTAEMIKYASNCMLATKISYWNELFLVCQELNINSQDVADIASLDARIGKYGTAHGKAFGGGCLPKDLKAFISFIQKYHKPKLLEAVDKINEEMKRNYGIRE